MKKISTRDKLITAMADALQRKGLHGVGLNELLAQAGAPKGSLYHHFPGGKSELADTLAALFVALYEGGLLQARVAGSSEPLKRAAEALFNLTRSQPPQGARACGLP